MTELRTKNEKCPICQGRRHYYVQHKVLVTFFGFSYELEHERLIRCDSCDGTGVIVREIAE